MLSQIGWDPVGPLSFVAANEPRPDAARRLIGRGKLAHHIDSFASRSSVKRVTEGWWSWQAAAAMSNIQSMLL